MSSVALFHRKDDERRKRDEALHKPILDSVQFAKTPAFKHSVKRATALGFDEQAARSMLNPPAVLT